MVRSFTPVVVVVAAIACSVIGLHAAAFYLHYHPIVGNPSFGGTTDDVSFLETIDEGATVALVMLAIMIAWLLWLAVRGRRDLWLVVPWLVVTTAPLVAVAFVPAFGLLIILHFWPIALAGLIGGLAFWAAMMLWALLERLDRG